MFLGLWGRMRKRREEKKKELERIQQEKRELSENRSAAAWVALENAKEEMRQRRHAQHLEALKVSSLDLRREQMQGTLTTRRAYLVDSQRQSPVQDTDSAMIAVQNLIQSAQESASSSCDSSSSSDSGSSDSGSCGSD